MRKMTCDVRNGGPHSCYGLNKNIKGQAGAYLDGSRWCKKNWCNKNNGQTFILFPKNFYLKLNDNGSWNFQYF